MAAKKVTSKTLTIVPVAPKPVAPTFDYESLKMGGDAISLVMTKTEETKGLLKRTAENIIQVGQNLVAVKDMLPHGAFQPWLHLVCHIPRRSTSCGSRNALVAKI